VLAHAMPSSGTYICRQGKHMWLYVLSWSPLIPVAARRRSSDTEIGIPPGVLIAKLNLEELEA
jgi:hypothetical protein